MDAIQFKVSERATNKYRKAMAVDTDICVGCGVCVHKCLTKSIVLERREEITRPPKNVKEFTRLSINDRLAAIGK